VMLVVPFATPVTRPVLAFTVATPGLVELYVKLPPEMKREIGKRLTGQTLFGSDYPFISLDRWFEEFEALGVTDQAREAILVGNATRLLGL